MTRTPIPAARAGVLWALVAAAAFSTLGIWGKLATQAGLSSDAALALRFGLVAALLSPFAARGVTRQSALRMLAVGGVYALATTCYFGALGRITAGATGLLLYLAPAFVVMFAWLRGRAPARSQLGAVLLTAAGLGLVVGLPGPADQDALGLLLGAGAGALYAAYLMISERWMAGQSALAGTAFMAVTAGTYFAGRAALAGTLHLPATGAQWTAILGMAAVPTLVAVPALYGAVRHLGAARASLLGTLEPLFTVLLAFVVLREPLRPTLLLGGR